MSPTKGPRAQLTFITSVDKYRQCRHWEGSDSKKTSDFRMNQNSNESQDSRKKEVETWQGVITNEQIREHRQKG